MHRRLVAPIIWIAAFNGIAFQIGCFKILHLLLGNSLISTSINLGVYLLGLNIGILIGGYCEKREGWKTSIGATSALILALYLGTICFNYDKAFLAFETVASAWKLSESLFFAYAFAVLFLVIPAVANGTLFTILYSIYAKSFSRFMFLDTVASMLGALVVGIYLIPLLGTDWTVFAIALSSCVVAVLLQPKVSLKAAPIVVVFFAIALYSHQNKNRNELLTQNESLLPEFSRSLIHQGLLGKDPKQIKTLFSEESPYGLITVLEGMNGTRALYINRRIMCLIPGKKERIPTLSETRVGEDAINAFIAGNAQMSHMANIGLGCGNTLGALLKSKWAKSVDLIEINPVIQTTSQFFLPTLDISLKDEKLHIFIEDAFRYFRRKSPSKLYQVVAMDVEEPTLPHSTALYTSEFFNDIRNRLDKKGVFAVWNYSLNSEKYQAIVYHTLNSVFPYVYGKYYGGESNSSSFFASAVPLSPEALKLTDSDLTFTFRLKSMKSDINTLTNMALLKEWRKATDAAPMLN